MFWSRKPRIEERCSFCEAPREALHLLVAGKHASICSGCLAHGLAALDGDVAGEPSVRYYARFALEAYLVSRAGHYPPAEEVRPLLEALVALLPDTPEARQGLAARALSLPYAPVALELLRGDPTPESTVTRAVASIQLGDYGPAEVELAQLEARADLPPALRVPIALHRIHIALRRGTDAQGGDAPRRSDYGALLGELDRCEARLAAAGPVPRELQLAIESSRAECFLRRDDAGRALEILDVAERKERGPQWLLLLGEAQSCVGRPDHARAAWSALLDRYPHAPHARAARERLAALDAAPYR